MDNASEHAVGRRRPRRIGLFGLFGCGNLGNDGSLEAMLDTLRVIEPDAEITCICADPVKVHKDFGVRSIRIGSDGGGRSALRALEKFAVTRKLSRVHYAFSHVRQFDTLIMPGTGILDDFGEGCWGMPASLFTWCFAARMCGLRVAFVSVGAGPIKHPISRLLMKAAARLAHFRSYRDAVSKDFMTSIGFDTRNDPIYPDIAFGLSSSPPVSAEPDVGQPMTVGVGIMTYFGWRGDEQGGAQIYSDYVAKLTRFIVWLLDQGHRVRILMGEGTDRRAIDDVVAAVAAERPEVVPERVAAEPADSLHDVMRQIAETQVVVATRFHNIVCALKMSKPCISIGYAKKNDVLMAEMGVGQFCQHIEQLDVDKLLEQFQALTSGRETYQRMILEANRRFAGQLAEQEQILCERVLLPSD